MSVPIWRIKYMPQTIDNVPGQDEIKTKLQDLIKQQNFPHLLFVGSEGIGKTTLAMLFAKQFLGKYHEANSKLVYANVPLTDEERNQARAEAYVSKSKIGSTAGKTMTSPAFIQVKVKPFVQLKVMGAPFKILIVKNFESLGSNQQAFRRLMETYGSNCRMILITSKISAIIDPIVSRCQLFLIPQMDYKSFNLMVKNVARNETLDIKEDVIPVLYKLCQGKPSKALDLLQLCSVSNDTIDLNTLFENSQKFKKDLVRSLLLMVLRGDFKKSRQLGRTILTNYRFNSNELFSHLIIELEKLPLNNYARCEIIKMIAEADFRAIDGQDGDIQVSALLSKLCLFSEYL
ncbi:MAG: AAA family ATPase [Candidatus Lokiarchaeota archaeon]|nr:AAA family ATPase [Candidatus Lokiarchaeota archaeon]